MRVLLQILILVFTTSLVAQKKYHFDYVYEFESVFYLTKEQNVKKQLVFINSSKNNYVLHYHELDTNKLELHFLDYEGVVSESKINKENFFMADTISSSCISVVRYNKKYYGYWKNYYFKNEKDTLINNKTYHHYIIKSSKKEKYIRKKKIATYHFIVNKNEKNFVPYLPTNICYNNWVKNKNIPNGSLYLMFAKDIDGKVLFKTRVRQKVKIEKYFSIPKECDYTKIR